MDLQIISIYFFSDEILKAYSYSDDPQCKMTTAEIITSVLTAALFFSGNQRLAISFLKTHLYIPQVVSEGHFNRRLHGIPKEIWNAIFSCLSEYFKQHHDSKEYVVDSFPVSVCENVRIFRSKIYSGKQFHGYSSSKKKFFFGIRVHALVTTKGEPIEFVFAPGSENDIKVFRNFDFNLPSDSTIYADRAYTDYNYEDFLRENSIALIPHRRANAKRQHNPCTDYLRGIFRKRIETTFSQITRLFPKSIHAVTKRGFELKVYLFILAYCLQLFLKQ